MFWNNCNDIIYHPWHREVCRLCKCGSCTKGIFKVFEAKINLGEIVECELNPKFGTNKFFSHGQS